VGPQLDGIGNRGLERILEDLLDPNRNVDVAFRTTTIVTTSGAIQNGIPLREEGQNLVLANQEGKEFSITKQEIEEQFPSPLSLMPANFGEVLTEQQLFDLAAFLASQR
jgi:putative heme-binding domain-containing protein